MEIGFVDVGATHASSGLSRTRPRATHASPLRIILGLCLLLLVGCARPPAAPPVLHLTDAVIEGEAVWSGEVRITGVVVVKKSGHLTILPGTRVLFTPIDIDGDGIGDSELLVEGGIVARGTPEQPILFTSAAENPQKSDWKFLYLNFAREGVIEHIISEYAFSGIQVHFCQASVKNSVFRHNVDGVRFSTVNLEVSGNLIHDNTHGLRFEERRGRAHVHHNEIRDNDINIFVVTRSDDNSLIEYNNITNSRLYHVRLGFDQTSDLTLPRNWWGSADPQEIRPLIFDHEFDTHLGRVAIPEPLPAPLSLTLP